MNSIADAGLPTYRRVLDDAHVDRAEAARTGFGAPFRALTTDAA